MQHPNNLKKLRDRRILSGSNKCPVIDFSVLKNVCRRPINDFHVYKGIGKMVKIDTPDGPYFYKDNGAKVLVVAHLDSVQDFHWAGVLNFKDETKIYCSTLDDRLGVYVALETLRAAGLEYDILLTTNEEKGNSTAQWFEPPKGKKYNWMVEFDRKGTDVVTYRYHETDWHLALQNVGFKIGHGTYSDISDLDHLGICGVNVGIGYYDYHYQDAYAKLHEIKEQVSRFIDFYRLNYEIEFEYAPRYNVLTAKGLSYSPYVVNRFSRDQYELALDLLEQLKTGQTIESLGYGHAYRITPESIDKGKPKKPIILKLDPHVNRGSEDEQSSKNKFVIYPQAMGTSAKDVAKDIEENGDLETIILDKCIECGDMFETKAMNSDPWCSDCKVVLESRHAKDEDDPGKPRVIGRVDWTEYKRKKKNAKANAPVIPEDKEAADKLAEEQIEGALSILNSGEVDSDDVASILKMAREGIPKELVLPIFDDLVKTNAMRPFKIGKGGATQNHPFVGTQKIQLSHGAVSALMTREDLSKDLKDSRATSYAKWIAKVESGHPTIWDRTTGEIKMFDSYLVMLADLVEDKWLPVINRVSTLNIQEIIDGYVKPHDRVVKPPPIEETLHKPGVKFKLDTSNRDYNFHSERKGEGVINTKWERVTPKRATA